VTAEPRSTAEHQKPHDRIQAPGACAVEQVHQSRKEQDQSRLSQDFVDIIALPVPAAYCDVVVTEKQWAHQMRQGKVPDRYSTIVLSNFADLVDVIVSASVT
jgi:hypothetical protein